MENAQKEGEVILAAVTIDKEKIQGDVPIFYADSEEEREKTANMLSRILKAMVHDLENGVYILVRH